MKVEVTAKHIKEGKVHDCTRCPIALALLDAGFGSAWVTTKWASLDFCPHVPLPASARRFIGRFDRGKSVKPFSFEIRKPDRRSHAEKIN